MNNSGDVQPKLNFVCFRCGSIIKAEDRMMSLSISLETPTEDDAIQQLENIAVSSLCFACASLMLSEAIVADKHLMMPKREVPQEVEDEDEKDIIISDDEEKDTRAKLVVRSSSKGFDLALDCGDGVSTANSQFFTWRQIVQMLISVDPDMFGVFDEPLHHVFSEALERLGLHVPR